MKLQLAVYLALVGVLNCGGNGGGPGSPTDDDQGDTDLTDNGAADTDTTDDDGDSATGQCTQGATRCGGSENLEIETCQASGTWTITALCPYVCSGGQCIGDCGPGSQRCCTGYANGDKSCGNQYVSACIGSACGQENPAVAVFIETCSPSGVFLTTSTCGSCAGATDSMLVACDTCSFADGALCSEAGGGCGSACP